MNYRNKLIPKHKFGNILKYKTGGETRKERKAREKAEYDTKMNTVMTNLYGENWRNLNNGNLESYYRFGNNSDIFYQNYLDKQQKDAQTQFEINRDSDANIKYDPQTQLSYSSTTGYMKSPEEYKSDNNPDYHPEEQSLEAKQIRFEANAKKPRKDIRSNVEWNQAASKAGFSGRQQVKDWQNWVNQQAGKQILAVDGAFGSMSNQYLNHEKYGLKNYLNSLQSNQQNNEVEDFNEISDGVNDENISFANTSSAVPVHYSAVKNRTFISSPTLTEQVFGKVVPSWTELAYNAIDNKLKTMAQSSERPRYNFRSRPSETSY